MEYSVFIKRFSAADPRLGRHVRHDSRSWNFQVEAESLGSLKSIRHTRHIPILDQGNLGSCTGNAATGCLGTGQFWNETAVENILSVSDSTHNEAVALELYSLATQLDSYAGTYPPNDTGSDGLSVAKAAQKMGLIAGYQHAMSLEAGLTALSKQPIIVGTSWRGDMFTPKPDGRLVITGSVEGGHEYELDELDMENKRVWMDQSWGVWGLKGRAYLTFDDFGTLLDDQGDCTVFTPLSQPAPTPTPPAPPAPPSPSDPKAEFLKAYNTFAAAVVKYTSQ